ncbi:MAG: hypothetical protein MUC92_08370 [Fimbriimonadaceae bacterium]|nr:hypothetical protein [Fimbriimonadaceae bacterium]
MKGALCLGIAALAGFYIPALLNQGNQATKTEGTAVVGPRDLLTTPVTGIERTSTTTQVVPITSQPFREALLVKVGRGDPETNATQLTILNKSAVSQGDLLLATFWMRGTRIDGNSSVLEFYFEKATDPWTKSVVRMVRAPQNPIAWRKVEIPFVSAQSYGPGEAMFSFRFAFAAQEVFLAGFTVENYQKTLTLEQLYSKVYGASSPEPVTLTFNKSQKYQTLAGLGGNFCQPRYGSQEAMDGVGKKILESLDVKAARIGIPLNHWAPQRGLYSEKGQARASFEAMKQLKSKGIPVMASVWEPPRWLMGGSQEQGGLSIPAAEWNTLIEIIGEYLRTAKEYYGVQPDYFSFNEPDYGINVKLSPQEYVRFIRDARKAWEAKGIKIKFLIGDTAGGAALPPYVEAKMAASDLQDVLGPIAYHTWDALSVEASTYEKIRDLGRKFNKPIWGTEAGHDAQLWQRPDPWASWENALRLTKAYARSARLSGASRLDYWTYQDNYTLVDPKSLAPYPAFHAMKMMETAFAPGWSVINSSITSDDVEHLASLDPTGRKMAILLANETGPKTLTIAGMGVGTSYKLQARNSTGAQARWQGRVHTPSQEHRPSGESLSQMLVPPDQNLVEAM